MGKRLFAFITLLLTLSFFVTAPALADDDLVPDAPASTYADVLDPEATASSSADVLGAQGAPAECPLDEDAAAASDEHAAEIPGSENDSVTPAAAVEPELDGGAAASGAPASAGDVEAAQDDGSDVPGSSASGLPAGADLAPRTAAADEAGESAGESLEAEVPEEETDAEQPLLLEAKAKVVAGWNKVGGKYYWHDSASSAAKRGWLVTGQLPTGGSGGLQRYWLGEGGALAVSTLVDAADAGWWAYARPEGYVVRGKYVASNGNVYLANNDGRLENPGWVVSNKYDGSMQRYYVDSKAHAAVSGYSADGWDHYTIPDKGYVARGKHVASNGNVYLANNDGRLEKPGWVVTNKYDGSMQRYWIDSKAHAAVPGYSNDGWAHYTLPNKGYVARGTFVDSAGRTKQADNDGRVKGGIPRKLNGWVVTSEFGHGMQRYWFRNDVMAKSELLTASETGWWAYARPEGYVVRGEYVAKDGYIYLANNDGRLENPGWVVTNKYGDGTQRYYVEAGPHAAVPGFSKSGWAHYTVPGKGYVVRGKSGIGDALVLADNDGRIETATGWLVTSKYDGHLERYYMVKKDGFSAARLGLFTVSGKQYFGIDGKGYVVRNASVYTGGKWYHGNNDGVLTYLKSGKVGWQNPSQYYQVSAYTVVLPDYSSGIFAYVTPSRIKPDATRAEVVEAFIARAYDYLGTGYIWDYACAPGVGVDCAGLVLQCMYAVGIKPYKYTPHDHYYTPGHDHYANDMFYDPKIMKVSYGSRQRGDLIYYPGHIGIYLGNNQIIHAYPGSVHVASVNFKAGLAPRGSVGRLFV